MQAISNILHDLLLMLFLVFLLTSTQFSRYLFSARSYMVNYAYYLVCLCFGIFGGKYFAYSYISVLFIPYSSFGSVNA